MHAEKQDGFIIGDGSDEIIGRMIAQRPLPRVLRAFSLDLLKVESRFSVQSILICMELANAGKF